MPVEVVFEKLTDEITLPLFQPAGGPDDDRAAANNASASSAWTRATRSARCPDKSQLIAAPGGDRQRRPRRRPEGLRHRRHLHRRPALARHHRRGARRRSRATSTAPPSAAAPSSSWSATRWLALHHGLCDVAVVSHGESGRSGVGVTPAARHRDPRPVRGPLRLRRRADLLRPDHHAPHARVRHHARAVGAGGRLHAQVGRAQPQGAQPRADHRRRTCSTRARSSGRSTC